MENIKAKLGHEVVPEPLVCGSKFLALPVPPSPLSSRFLPGLLPPCVYLRAPRPEGPLVGLYPPLVYTIELPICRQSTT